MAIKNSPQNSSGISILIGFGLAVGILYVAKPVLVPLALAVMLAFILSPVVGRFQSYGLRRVPAAVLAVALTLTAFAAIGWGVGAQINRLAVELPEKKEKIKRKINDLRPTGEGTFAKLFRMVRELEEGPKTPEIVGDAATPTPKEIIAVRREEPTNFDRLIQFAVPVLEPLVTAGFVIILVLFMLVNREDLRNRLISLLGHGHLTGTTRALVDGAERVSRFLLTQLLINVAFAVIFTIGLLVMGVPYAVLWGFLIAVLRFIPYIGTWVAVGFPFLLSFTESPGWTQPLMVIAFAGVLDMVTANVIEPLLFGHSTGVTPIALLVAAAFWTWIWGPIGLVMATPLTVCLVVLGQHVPRLRFFSLLLGSQPPLKPHVSFYQRLLAKDIPEATQVATDQAKASGLPILCDEVFLPALALARRDRKNHGLTTAEEAAIFEATKAILDQVVQTLDAADNTAHPASPPQDGEIAHPVSILGCPAHHEAEELSLNMLECLLKETGCHLEIISTKALPIEVEDRVSAEHPALVFISILPPGGLIQARYLCRRLRRRFKRLPIVVGFWAETNDFDRLLVTLRAAGASYVTTSLVQARGQILALVGPSPSTAPVQSLQHVEAV